MKNEIREMAVFRITIEREKLAKDKKGVCRIFELLEECRIPCECIAINIDWLAIVIRESEYGKLSGFLVLLRQTMSKINTFIEREMALLCIVGEEISSRGIGMVTSSLIMQGIEIKMQRYLQCRDRFMVCVSTDAAKQAGQIIAGILDGGDYFAKRTDCIS
ncbi:MAG: hypothetical protein K2I01_06015 [Lachnospiraceae bacterium]|nr:hypothetical protein [Lachnospiraceae bacterium]